MDFGGLWRDIFLFGLFIEEILHSAYLVDLSLSCLCLLIKIVALLSPNILIMRLLEISLRVWLEGALRIFLRLLLLSNLLFF